MNIRTKFIFFTAQMVVSLVILALSTEFVLRNATAGLKKLGNSDLNQLLAAEALVDGFSSYRKDIEISLSTADLKIARDLSNDIDHMSQLLAELKNNYRAEVSFPGFDQLTNQLHSLHKETIVVLDEIFAGDVKNSDDFDQSKLEAIGIKSRALGENFNQIMTKFRLNYKQSIQQIKQSYSELRFAILIILAIMIFSCTLFFFKLIRPILARIDRLRIHLAGTQLDSLHEYIEVQPDDELNHLNSSVNIMIAAIRDSKKQLVDKKFIDQIINDLPDMLFVLDSNFNIIRLNPIAVSTLKLEQLPNVPKGFFELTHCEQFDTSKHQKAILSLGIDENISFEGEFLFAEGKTIPFWATVSRMSEQRTGLSTYILIARDQSALKLEEKHKRKLESQVVHNTKLAALGTLGAGIAHELNNPLMAVKGFAEILENSMEKSDANKRMTSKILKATGRMKDIIDHVRRFASDSSENKKQVFSIYQSTSDALVFIHAQLNALKVSVSLRLDESEGQPMAYGDQTEMESIFNNLLSNSRDAFEGSSEAKNRIIDITSRLEKETVVLVYKDNAGGIPDEVQPRIFDPFFSTKDTGKGTGIGLHMCFNIIQRHGGSISLMDTNEADTTVFEIRLPVHSFKKQIDDSSEGTTEPIATITNKNHTKKRLLVVDDEPLIREVIAAFLEGSYIVDLAEDANEALRMYSLNSYDLVLTDIKMPGMHGDKLSKRILKQNPSQPIIVMTGHAYDDKQIQLLYDLGIKKVLSKPLEGAKQLIIDINQVIDSSSKPSLKTTPDSKALPFLLLVEDEEGIIELLVDLWGDDFNIIVAREKHEVESAIANACYDVALVDLNLKTFTGYEVLTWMQNARSPSPSFVATGSFLSAVEMETLKKLGAQEIFIKPYEFEYVLSCLKIACNAEKQSLAV